MLVEGSDHVSAVQVQPPVTLEFDINRTYYSSANHFQLRVYNLNKNRRNALRKDLISYQFGAEDFRQITLVAGYGTNMPLILKGNVVRGFSVREGNNMITQLEGFDSGFAFANGVTANQYSAGSLRQNMMLDLASSLPNTSLGCISQSVVAGAIPRGNALDGNTTDILGDLTGGAFFIDNGTVHILGDNECTDDKILLINSQSGLLGTPTLEQTTIHMDILFEPKVKVGQRVLVESITESRFNGLYKVIGVHHHGTISDAVCGEAVTHLAMVDGTFNPIARAIR